MGKRLTTKIFIERANELHGDTYDYSLVEYKNSLTKVKIICKKHGIFEQIPHNHLNKSGCKRCGNKLIGLKKRLTKKDFVCKSQLKHGNKYDYSKAKYITSHDKVEIVCPSHGSFLQTPNNHLNGQDCPICGKIKKIKNKTDDILKFSSKANKVHNFKYNYDKVKYIASKQKVEIICPSHGSFLQIPNSHLNGHGCPKCNKSKGEVVISNLLNKSNIIFIEQKRFDKCKNKKHLSFDFYLPSYNLLIEYNGEQHYNPIPFFGGVNGHKKQIINDVIKKDFCTKNEIDLLIIPYTEYENIDEIIKIKLKKYIN